MTTKSPALNPRSDYKSSKVTSLMEDRIGFENADDRKEFFFVIRKAVAAESWLALAKRFELSRSHFQKYQYGECLLPESLFKKMLDCFSEQDGKVFREKVFTKPGNWGASKGGEITSGTHPEFVANARKFAVLAVKNRVLAIPPINMPLSEELCEFIGAVIGDGCVDGFLQGRNGLSKYHVSITGHSMLDKDYLSRYHPELIRSLFGVKCNLYYRKDCNAMVMNIHSKTVFCLLTKRFGFVPGNKIYTTKIPSEILTAGEKFVFAAIRGIFDTDGCVFFDKRAPYKNPYPRIVIQIKSEPLFFQLKEILEKYFSIYAKCNRRNTYCVEIYGHAQFDKWMELIGFSNKKHLDRIKQYCKPEGGIEPPISSSLA